jgi:DNA-binding CsgD family transcriptional regulator
MRAARLIVFQAPRNPTERERRILALLAEGHSQRAAAAHLGVKPRAVTSKLQQMRNRYTARTNEALVALAVRLEWIAVAIECDGRTPDTIPTAGKPRKA